MIELLENQFLPLFNEPINVVCSGGLDSSLLLYLLTKYHENSITVWTCGNREKHFRATKVVPQVIEYCIESTNFDLSKLQHRIFYTSVQNTQTLFDPINRLVQDQKIYTGVTADPPWGVEFGSPRTQTHARDPGIMREIIRNNYVLPFTNLNKRHIVAMYKHFQIQDLIPLTNSCERRDNDLNHCGKCWWCEERTWGLDV